MKPSHVSSVVSRRRSCKTGGQASSVHKVLNPVCSTWCGHSRLSFASLCQGAGLPDFCWYNIPKRGKYTKRPQNVPKDHKIYQMVGKLTECPLDILTSSIERPSKIYTNWDFCFENRPSGNTAKGSTAQPDVGSGFSSALGMYIHI
jgi:hypothetical protein